MALRAMAHPDIVPHLSELLVSMALCWRSIGDAQTEVDPFGSSYAVLDMTSLALSGRCTHSSLSAPKTTRMASMTRLGSHRLT